MLSLSVCIIASREEPLIGSTLRSVKDCADEIILVDTGLDEKTRAEIETFRESNPDIDLQIFKQPWEDDFSKARNFSLEKATKDWIFIIDADEFASSEDVLKLLDRAEQDPKINAFSLSQKTYTNSSEILGFVPLKTNVQKRGANFTFEGYIERPMTRLFRNDKRIRFENPVHESVNNAIERIEGQLIRSDVTIHHLKELKGPGWENKTQLHYLDIYNKNIDRFANTAEAYSELGILHYAYAKDYPQAVKLLGKAMQLHAQNNEQPEPKTVLTFAYAYFMSDDFPNAKRVFEQYIREFPDDVNVYRARSALQMISERLEEMDQPSYAS